MGDRLLPHHRRRRPRDPQADHRATRTCSCATGRYPLYLTQNFISDPATFVRRDALERGRAARRALPNLARLRPLAAGGAAPRRPDRAAALPVELPHGRGHAQHGGLRAPVPRARGGRAPARRRSPAAGGANAVMSRLIVRSNERCGLVRWAGGWAFVRRPRGGGLPAHVDGCRHIAPAARRWIVLRRSSIRTSWTLDGTELLVSHGYRHILPPQLLRALEAPAVNLHISLLPWNRGAHPNVLERLRGLAIRSHRSRDRRGGGVRHREGLSCNESFPIQAEETLKSRELRAAPGGGHGPVCVGLERHPRVGRTPAREQGGGGSYHRVSDLERIKHAMPHGLETSDRRDRPLGPGGEGAVVITVVADFGQVRGTVMSRAQCCRCAGAASWTVTVEGIRSGRFGGGFERRTPFRGAAGFRGVADSLLFAPPLR